MARESGNPSNSPDARRADLFASAKPPRRKKGVKMTQAGKRPPAASLRDKPKG